VASSTSGQCPRRYPRAPAVPPPALEGDVFKFPPVPVSFALDEYAESALLNYVTLATQDIATPTSAGAVSRYSLRGSITSPSPTMPKPVEYAKIDAVATQAARKAVTSRRDEFLERHSPARTVSDGEHCSDVMSQSVISNRSAEKSRRSLLKKKLQRRLSIR